MVDGRSGVYCVGRVCESRDTSVHFIACFPIDVGRATHWRSGSPGRSSRASFRRGRWNSSAMTRSASTVENTFTARAVIAMRCGAVEPSAPGSSLVTQMGGARVACPGSRCEANLGAPDVGRLVSHSPSKPSGGCGSQDAPRVDARLTCGLDAMVYPANNSLCRRWRLCLA